MKHQKTKRTEHWTNEKNNFANFSDPRLAQTCNIVSHGALFTKLPIVEWGDWMIRVYVVGIFNWQLFPQPVSTCFPNTFFHVETELDLGFWGFAGWLLMVGQDLLDWHMPYQSYPIVVFWVAPEIWDAPLKCPTFLKSTTLNMEEPLDRYFKEQVHNYRGSRLFIFLYCVICFARSCEQWCLE